jgi:geranylgeranyl pyrophosphate synthase
MLGHGIVDPPTSQKHFRRHSGDTGRSRRAATLPQRLWNQGLFQPAEDFLARRGKQIRAEIVSAAFAVGGGRGEVPSELRDFMELLHAGSLIVDDIEDGSNERRGAPALHCTHGIPIALNTGNWMYFLALEKLMLISNSPSASISTLRLAITVIRRCHEGQALDLAARVDELGVDEVAPTCAEITRLKTGALTGLGARLGGMAAGAELGVCRALEAFGRRLGVALQMQNDLQELESAALQGRSDDLRNARTTWPWAWAAELCPAECFQSLQRRLSTAVPNDLDRLAIALLKHVAKEGRLAIDNQFQQAMGSIDRRVGPSASRCFQSVLKRLKGVDG